MREATVNPPMPNGRFTTIALSRRDSRLIGATQPITGQMFGQQKSQGPAFSKGTKEIIKRMKNRIVPL